MLIGDSWVPVDGAIVAEGAADAARFAFERGSLAGGPSELTNSAGARLYGAISVRVLAYQLSGARQVTLDTSAAPYVVRGSRYRNAHLGIDLVRPSGSRFTELDETWPSMTIVAVANRSSDTVRVRSLYRDPWVMPAEDARARVTASGAAPTGTPVRVRDRTGWIGGRRGHAVLAIPNGGETVTVEATGPDASALVLRVAGGLVLHPR